MMLSPELDVSLQQYCFRRAATAEDFSALYGGTRRYIDDNDIDVVGLSWGTVLAMAEGWGYVPLREDRSDEELRP